MAVRHAESGRLRSAAHAFEGKVFVVVAATALDNVAVHEVAQGDARIEKALTATPEVDLQRDRRQEILASRDLALSVQFLQQFYVQATRQSRGDALTHEQGVALVESFMRFPVAPMTTELMMAAFAAHRRFGISYWDAAVLEAGRSLGCDVVLSEDLSDDEDCAGVHVENPFR